MKKQKVVKITNGHEIITMHLKAEKVVTLKCREKPQNPTLLESDNGR